MNMITLDDFLAMSKDEKIAALEKGTFLAERKEDQVTVRLYSLGTFYVESFWDRARDKALHFIAFKSNDLLLPYIKKDFMANR